MQRAVLLAAVAVAAAAVVVVEARCNCVAHVSGGDRSSRVQRINVGCNDLELLEQCRAAKRELTDWVNAVMDFVRTLAQSYPEAETRQQEALNEAALSEALERERPEPKCTDIFTTTVLDGSGTVSGWGTYSKIGKCYSPALLHECERVEREMPRYVEGVMQRLAQSQASRQFVELVRVRVVHSVPPVIYCNSTHDHRMMIARNTNAAAAASVVALVALILPLAHF